MYKVKTVNTPVESPCENCGTVTTAHYLLDPGAGSDEIKTCETCLTQEINTRNNGQFTRSDWYENPRALTDSELIKLVEGEYINNARPIRWDSRICSEYDHLELAEQLVEEDRLDTTVSGTDEAESFRPIPERRLELIRTFNLLEKWDVGFRRKQTIKEELRSELEEEIEFT